MRLCAINAFPRLCDDASPRHIAASGEGFSSGDTGRARNRNPACWCGQDPPSRVDVYVDLHKAECPERRKENPCYCEQARP